MNRSYRHLPALDIERAGYALHPVADADIEAIRQWRNAQMDVLRQSHPIAPDEQVAYFDRAIWPQMDEEQPDTILLTVLRNGRAIGYGGLVHCQWEHARAEISVLFDPVVARSEKDYRPALLTFLNCICELGFARLGLNRLTLETFATREAHIALIEESGFTCEGRLRQHVCIEGAMHDSLIHARLAQDYQGGSGGRMTSSATRSIREPSGGGS